MPFQALGGIIPEIVISCTSFPSDLSRIKQPWSQKRQNEWIPDKTSDIMLFFIVGMELDEVKMTFKHMCKQEVKKWGNLDLNQGPAGYEGGRLSYYPITSSRYG